MLKSNDSHPLAPADMPRIDLRITQYLEMRDELDQRTEKFKRWVAPIHKVMAQIEGELMQFMDKTGQKTAITPAGRVTISVRDTASCSDPDAFVDYVRDNDAYYLMDRKANALACKEHAQAHDGILPPGVRISSKRTVGVTKA